MSGGARAATASPARADATTIIGDADPVDPVTQMTRVVTQSDGASMVQTICVRCMFWVGLSEPTSSSTCPLCDTPILSPRQVFRHPRESYYDASIEGDLPHIQNCNDALATALQLKPLASLVTDYLTWQTPTVNSFVDVVSDRRVRLCLVLATEMRDNENQNKKLWLSVQPFDAYRNAPRNSIDATKSFWICAKHSYDDPCADGAGTHTIMDPKTTSDPLGPPGYHPAVLGAFGVYPATGRRYGVYKDASTEGLVQNKWVISVFRRDPIQLYDDYTVVPALRFKFVPELTQTALQRRVTIGWDGSSATVGSGLVQMTGQQLRCVTLAANQLVRIHNWSIPTGEFLQLFRFRRSEADHIAVTEASRSRRSEADSKDIKEGGGGESNNSLTTTELRVSSCIGKEPINRKQRREKQFGRDLVFSEIEWSRSVRDLRNNNRFSLPLNAIKDVVRHIYWNKLIAMERQQSRQDKEQTPNDM